jgi:hypothetical protein
VGQAASSPDIIGGRTVLLLDVWDHESKFSLPWPPQHEGSWFIRRIAAVLARQNLLEDSQCEIFLK